MFEGPIKSCTLNGFLNLRLLVPPKKSTIKKMKPACAFNYCLKYIFYVSLASIYIVGSKGIDVDMKNIKITGPGIRPDKIVLPARYFFINLYQNKLTR